MSQTSTEVILNSLKQNRFYLVNFKIKWMKGLYEMKKASFKNLYSIDMYSIRNPQNSPFKNLRQLYTYLNLYLSRFPFDSQWRCQWWLLCLYSSFVATYSTVMYGHISKYNEIWMAESFVYARFGKYFIFVQPDTWKYIWIALL